jgi:hypothetical protein
VSRSTTGCQLHDRAIRKGDVYRVWDFGYAGSDAACEIWGYTMAQTGASFIRSANVGIIIAALEANQATEHTDELTVIPR